MDYLRFVAQIAKSGKADLNKRNELLAGLADAKARICVYGSAKVIEALAAFERDGPVLDTDSSTANFLDLCDKIRQESTDKVEIVQAESLRLILFGSKD